MKPPSFEGGCPLSRPASQTKDQRVPVWSRRNGKSDALLPLTSRGGGTASSVSDWRPSDALAHHLQPPPCAFGPGTAASSRLLTAEKSCASRLGLANAGRGTVRAQLRAVPAGGAWPNLHSTLRPCDVSRAFLYKAGERRNSRSSFRPSFCVPFSRALRALPPTMSTGVYPFPMEVAVYQLHNFSISFFSSLLGGDVVSVKLDNSASGASVVAIDNKIEQAMDLVKNHLMYAVREEVEVLKEQIKELAEKNCRLEHENSLLKNLASPEQLQKFRSHLLLDTPVAEKKSQGAAAPAQHRAGSAV